MNKALDIAGMLAILYTVGYFAIVLMMMKSPLPEGNEGSLNQLIGALTIIQTGIIGFYFGGSKANETTQQTIVDSKAKTDEAMIQIAKAAPAPATNGAPLVTPAPVQSDGTIPAASAIEVKPKETP